jgi:single-strand DNA-binding protein
MDEQQFELLLTMAMVLRASSHRFIGRLAWDPELKAFDSGKCVAKSRLLVNLPGAKRDDGSKPDGFTLELWNEDAQRFVDGAHKGDLVEVTGRARTNRWTDRNTGEVKKEVLIEVERWELVRPAGQQAAPAVPAAA